MLEQISQIAAPTPTVINAGISPTLWTEQLRVDSVNGTLGTRKSMGDLFDYYDCPECKNRGFVAYINEKTALMQTKECGCMKKRRTLRHVKKLGIEDMVKRYTFDNYQTPAEWQRTAKNTAIKYAQNPTNSWFAITGNSGSGKSHLTVAVANALLASGYEVHYFFWRSEIAKLKADILNREAYEQTMRKLQNVDVLVIDDFLKGTVSDSDKNIAFELIDKRYNNRKSTVISSERTIEEMLNIDEAIGGRIFERSKGFCIKTPHHNWRLGNAPVGD